METSKSKLNLIRREMKKQGLAALIIPSSDPHLGEYIPEHWRIISWLTGFTGSAGTVVITPKFAGLWTDSRYFIQAARQLEGTGFELVKLIIPHTPEYIGWLVANIKKKGVVGVDGRVLSIGLKNQIEKEFKRKEIALNPGIDITGQIWTGRPLMPQSIAFDHTLEFAGISRGSKISEVRGKMAVMGVDYQLLTSPDDIMWMLNIRGNDVGFSPVIMCFAIVTVDQVMLFVNDEQIPYKMKMDFDRDGIVILPYETLTMVLARLQPRCTLLLNPATTSAAIYSAVNKNVAIDEDVSIPTRLKAVKNAVEIENIRKTMIKDGVALTKFFFWLESNVGKESITEVTAADKLLEFRMLQEDCKGPSFATISAWNGNAASPHYSPSRDNDTLLEGQGIYLLDSGGQYLGGTTDVTRCVVFGEPTPRQKRDFTLALKGTIGLAMAKFPVGTKGFQIEILARKALWENGLNYGHGTGHGVGYFLNVHEGPQTIGTGASGDMKTVFEPGMLTADEPAIYRPGEYGFRTENLILCVEDELTSYGQFLKFETVTLCYIDTRLLETSLLTSEEIGWFNDYHNQVYATLAPLLSKVEKGWLKEKTQPVAVSG